MSKLNKKQKYEKSVIEDCIASKLKNQMAARKLNLSRRGFLHKKSKYKKYGEASLIHGNKGKTPVNITGPKKSLEIYFKYSEIYLGFNFSHFMDMEDLGVSLPTVKRILNNAGFVSPQAHRSKKKNMHPLRPRREKFGELIQMDASIHDWFSNGTKAALHVAIDDATSKIVGAYFCEQETLNGYLEVLDQIIDGYGIPESFYTDRRTVFEYNSKVKKKNSNTQFQRILKNLGCGLYVTSNPQAKGRVERVNRTLQDRLLKEMKLLNIKDINLANKFLAEFILRHNEKYQVDAASDDEAFTSIDHEFNANMELSLEYDRIILSGCQISFENIMYMPYEGDKLIKLEPNSKVKVHKCLDGSIYIDCEYKRYKCKPIKTGNSHAIKPAWNHPWKELIKPCKLEIYRGELGGAKVAFN
jgi:transposase InsO family protein